MINRVPFDDDRSSVSVPHKQPAEEAHRIGAALEYVGNCIIVAALTVAVGLVAMAAAILYFAQ